MEDQPTDPGDLTTNVDPVDPPTDAVDPPTDSDAAPADTAQTPTPQQRPVGKRGRTAKVVDAETEEPILLSHRPAGKRPVIAAAAAGALFVAAGAFAGATVQPYLADRALVDSKLEVARTAGEAITTLWTYTPDDMETLPNRAEKYLADDFSYEYRRFIDSIVATNKQSQVSNTTEVVGAAVESISPTEATAIVYTNSVSTSPVSKNIPSLRYLSYRLTMERQDSEWLINRMNAVTQLDLTPKL